MFEIFFCGFGCIDDFLVLRLFFVRGEEGFFEVGWSGGVFIVRNWDSNEGGVKMFMRSSCVFIKEYFLFLIVVYLC